MPRSKRSRASRNKITKAVTDIAEAESVLAKKAGNLGQVGSRRNRRRARRNNRRNRPKGPHQVASPALLHFVEAVVNPFSDAAIGAIMPDAWQSPTIPSCDRISLDLLDTAIPLLALEGWLVAIVPRSIAAGWLVDPIIAAGPLTEEKSYTPSTRVSPVARIDDSGFEPVTIPTQNRPARAGVQHQPQSHPLFEAIRVGGEAPEKVVTLGPKQAALLMELLEKEEKRKMGIQTPTNTVPAIQFINLNGSLDQADTDQQDPNWGLPYCLLVAAIGTKAGDPKPFYYFADLLNSAGVTARKGVALVQFSRTSTLLTTMAKQRLIGAGLKVWSNEAPIETGGTCYGGWLPVETLRASLIGVSGITVPYDNPYLEAPVIQDGLEFRTVQQGIDGVTVRYSPLQGPEQAHYIATRMPPGNLVYSYNDTTKRTEVDIAVGADDSAYDQIRPGTSIPAIVWAFSSTTNTYSLRVEARAHSQCVPDGTVPFMSNTTPPDPMYDQVRYVLENKDLFPVACSGHSFRSFFTKAGAISKRMASYAQKASNAMGFVHKWLGASTNMLGNVAEL